MSEESAERWAAVPGYDGFYQASDQGRVRSIDRVLVQPTRWGGTAARALRGQVLAPWTDPDGYLHVPLRGQRRAVHTLVAAAFLGPRPEDMQVRHLDGDPSNNRPENLAYGTGSDNCLDMVRHGTHHETRRTECPRGHPLVEPNLIPTGQATGRRTCLACNRAHSEARRLREKGISFDFQDLADARYAEVRCGQRRKPGPRAR